MYEKITLDNGVRVLTEHVKDVRSASLGVWVGAGSRHELARHSGASHFIEHMLFKGTATRTAFDLAAFMDSIGGQVNAFTTKEMTCYHGRVIDTRLPDLTEVLGDMLLRSRFDTRDVKSERNVILEELDMYEDTPEDVASESLFRKIFAGSLGRPILGSATTLARLTSSSLRAYMDTAYRGGSIVVALAGSFTDDDVKRVTDVFSEVRSGGENAYEGASYSPALSLRRKDTEQNHICLAFPCVSLRDDRRYAMQLLSDNLGGGMSSRLFQKAREERGLCYSIYSYVSSFTDVGAFFVSTALNPENERELLRLVADEITRFRDGGVTDEELERSREQARSNVLMSLESTSSRMNRLGRNELTYGRVLTPEETVARYDAVTREDVSRLAAEVLDANRVSLSVVGRVKPRGTYLDILRSFR